MRVGVRLVQSDFAAYWRQWYEVELQGLDWHLSGLGKEIKMKLSYECCVTDSGLGKLWLVLSKAGRGWSPLHGAHWRWSWTLRVGGRPVLSYFKTVIGFARWSWTTMVGGRPVKQPGRLSRIAAAEMRWKTQRQRDKKDKETKTQRDKKTNRPKEKNPTDNKKLTNKK